jgi:hypothetical protein
VYKSDDDVLTVFDDFHGVSLELTEKRAVATRYPIDDKARLAHRLADAFDLGFEALRRAESLEKIGKVSPALVEYQRAIDGLEPAVG